MVVGTDNLTWYITEPTLWEEQQEYDWLEWAWGIGAFWGNEGFRIRVTTKVVMGGTWFIPYPREHKEV